jgi:hypothetical protein
MSNPNNPTSQNIELEMIGLDTNFYSQLTAELIKNSAKSGILYFGLAPYLSLFVIETYNFFSSKSPVFANAMKRQHEDILRASRTRTKLFDDSQKDIDVLINHLEWATEFVDKWMNEDHVGTIAFLQKWLQPDMGLFFYDNHLICTTQFVLFNMGLEQTNITTTERGKPINLSELAKSIGYDIGQYIGSLSNGLTSISNNSAIPTSQYQLNNSLFHQRDKKSKNYLRRIYNGYSTPQLNLCLLLFSTTTNFLNHTFSKLVINNPETWFKVKFLTLYHTVSSLTKLQNYFYTTGQLSELSKYYFGDLLGNKEIKLVRNQAKFRNILVHYSLNDLPDSTLNPMIKHFGIIEHFFSGRKFEDVEEIVDRQLLRLSTSLEEWQNQLPSH